MRKLGQTTIVAAVLALLAVPFTATAKDVPGVPDTSYPVYDGLPFGWAFEFVPLATPEYGPAGEVNHVEGTAAPGWGTGSLQLHLGPVSLDKLTFSQSLDGLTSASIWVSSSQIAVAPAKVEFSVEVAGEQWYGQLPTGEAWTEVDLGHLGLAPYASTTPTTTLLQVAAAHPTDAVLGFATMNGYDSGGTQTYLDGWSVTRNGTTRRFDFEGPHESTSCLLAVTPTVITAGQEVAVTGSVSTLLTGSPLAGRELDLVSRFYGAADPLVWSPGPEEQTDALGHYTFRVRPELRVSYQIALPQAATAGRCLSEAVTVRVRTAVGLSAPDRVRRGRTVTVRGDTSPAKPGARVTLWARSAGGTTRLARGTVAGDGRYLLTFPAKSAGTLSLFTKVAAADGNLAGRSPVRPLVIF